MMTYAIIQNGVVTGTFLSDDAFAQAAYPGSVRIDALDPMPGVGWSHASGSFAAPSPETPPTPTNPVFDKLSFFRLFTDAEFLAMSNYQTNSSLPADVVKQLNAFNQLINAATYVSVGDPSTVAGVGLLESCGLIGAGRAAQILASRN